MYSLVHTTIFKRRKVISRNLQSFCI